MNLQDRIAAAISNKTGKPVHISNSQSAHGGCINDSRVVTLEDGCRFFIKTNAHAAELPGLFATEFLALQKLSAPAVINVPTPLVYADDFIVMEAFIAGAPAPDWHEQMGRQLASLHQMTRQEKSGFEQQNYLGTTIQPNEWCSSWLDFFREQRLGWQLALFAKKTGADDELLLLGDRLMQSLEDIIGTLDEPAVLLHGDLWSGNAAADEKGAPIIFDPASYYGHREMELGMMRLFGGFGPRCEAAYNEVWPLEPDADRRIALYRLYHELNHLNLFGAGYYSTCLSTVRGLL